MDELAELKDFYNKNKNTLPKEVIFPEFENDVAKVDFVMYQSGLPYWEIPFKDMPYQEMYNEAKALKHLFQPHRAYDPSQKVGYAHNGWSSLTIHGISSKHTMNWDSYDEYEKLGSEDLVPYIWTDIKDRIPVTVDFFKNKFPHCSYRRLRYMLIPPGGYILPHSDYKRKQLYPVNIALNNPEGCEFIMENNGVVPFKPGKAFLLDVSNRHSVWNNSNEDRIHVIAQWKNKNGKYTKEWIDKVSQQYTATL
jgi:hypothetical protein